MPAPERLVQPGPPAVQLVVAGGLLAVPDRDGPVQRGQGVPAAAQPEQRLGGAGVPVRTGRVAPAAALVRGERLGRAALAHQRVAQDVPGGTQSGPQLDGASGLPFRPGGVAQVAPAAGGPGQRAGRLAGAEVARSLAVGQPQVGGRAVVLVGGDRVVHRLVQPARGLVHQAGRGQLVVAAPRLGAPVPRDGGPDRELAGLLLTVEPQQGLCPAEQRAATARIVAHGLGVPLLGRRPALGAGVQVAEEPFGPPVGGAERDRALQDLLRVAVAVRLVQREAELGERDRIAGYQGGRLRQ